MPLGTYGARGNGQFPVQIDWVRDPTDMPEQEEPPATPFVDGLGHEFPALDLLRRADPRRVGVANPRRIDRRRLG